MGIILTCGFLFSLCPLIFRNAACTQPLLDARDMHLFSILRVFRAVGRGVECHIFGDRVSASCHHFSSPLHSSSLRSPPPCSYPEAIQPRGQGEGAGGCTISKSLLPPSISSLPLPLSLLPPSLPLSTHSPPSLPPSFSHHFPHLLSFHEGPPLTTCTLTLTIPRCHYLSFSFAEKQFSVFVSGQSNLATVSKRKTFTVSAFSLEKVYTAVSPTASVRGWSSPESCV